MIQVELPAHLRTLAHVDGEVKIGVEREAVLGWVLDALEGCYPMLCGTIRAITSLSSAVRVLRFFACETDLPKGACFPTRLPRVGLGLLLIIEGRSS